MTYRDPKSSNASLGRSWGVLFSIAAGGAIWAALILAVL